MSPTRHFPTAARAARPRGWAVVALIAAAAVFQWAALVWFLAEPLPNARNAGGNLRHWVFMARALPGVVPGLRYSESYLGLAMGELKQTENLPQRLPIAAAALAIAGAGMALGDLILAALGLRRRLDRGERAAAGFGLGLVALSLMTLGLGRMGWLGPWVARGMLALPVAGWIGGRCAAGRGEERIGARNPLPGLAMAAVAGPFLAAMALGAMLPTIDFDALEYHLQAPKEYYLAGRVAFLPHNVYASMPFGVEMLHLLAMEALGDWWRGALAGQLVVMLHAPAAAALIAATARRWGSPRAAWFAAAVYLTTPWVSRLAVIPYVEGPLCYFHAALLWAVGRAGLGLVGAFAGGAMACKYPGLVSAVAPFGAAAGLAAVRARSARPVAAFALGVGVVVGPWLAKNAIDTGNPVYPLAYRTFGGGPWSEAREAKFAAGHGRKPPTWAALGEGLRDVAGRSDWQSPLYLMLAPLALLRPGSRRVALALWAYAAYLFATWWLLTHRIDRFWLPLLPVLAVLAGLGADWTRRRAWWAALVPPFALAVLTNLSYGTTAMVGLNRWTDDLEFLRDDVPRMINAPLAALDRDLPPGAKVLLVGQASVFHMRHAIAYNTVFDDEIIEQVAWEKAPEEARRALAERGITHVYVDWPEIERHRKPGGYGFSPRVTPELFAGLVRAGVLVPLIAPGLERSLYAVVPDRARTDGPPGGR